MSQAPLENAAWVTVSVACSAQTLVEFVQNLERLFRLNPYLEIRQWKDETTEGIAKKIQFSALNEMNGVLYDVSLNFSQITPQEFVVHYSASFKERLEVKIADAAPHATLTLIEHYRKLPAGEHQRHLQEVDQGLTPWAVSIKNYIEGLARWGCLPFYRWYKEKFWLSMIPRHRRIARLLLWTTVLEFIVFFFVFIIYWLEAAR